MLLGLAPLAGLAQDLPRLHITALGMQADRRVVTPGEVYHVTIHVHVREKRDRLDELELPTLNNAIDLGDERRRTPAPDGTDFYETLTVESNTAGTASFSPAYIDAIDPATGRGMRYSSRPLEVRVRSGTGVNDADPDALAGLLRTAALTIGLILVTFVILIWLLMRFLRKPRAYVPPPASPAPARVVVLPSDPLDRLRDALAGYRARGDDPSLDLLRSTMFTRAGAAPGATFADAMQALGSRDPDLGRAMAVAERARFGPIHERGPAARDLLAILDTYVHDREPVA